MNEVLKQTFLPKDKEDWKIQSSLSFAYFTVDKEILLTQQLPTMKGESFL